MSKTNRSYLSVLFAVISLVLASQITAFTQELNHANVSNVTIKNFGQMDDRFYRGARPDENDYAALAALGVNTIIDLTDNSKEYEKPAVEAAGLRYINIPMEDKSYPSINQVNEFLKVVDDPATGKFFVHCAGGRHRTGVVGAVYRFTHDKWNLDQAVAEMEQYDFSSGYGHGKQRDFVKDYWNELQGNADLR